MKILKIQLLKKTSTDDYMLITFKTFFGNIHVKKCRKPNWNIGTMYMGKDKIIPVRLWGIVDAFLASGDEMHNYIDGEEL